MFQISDEQVQEAFDVLHNGGHARARAAYEYAERRLKSVLAKAEMSANAKTVGERQATALASAEYEAALTKFHLIAQAYHSERDRRDAASACMDAWRTQSSDRRAMGKVG